MPEPIPQGYPDRIQKTKDDLIKEAMHEMPYGIYVIGTSQGGRPNGMIADWVMQVSFDPRLIAVAFERDSTSLAAIRENRAFTVNLLKQQDNGMALAAGFVQPRKAEKIRGRSEAAAGREYDKLADVDYTTTPRDCPLLDAALAWYDCEAQDFVPVGDHVLVSGRVLDARVVGSGDPLTSTFTGWSYSG
jgi:flavin reductase (DIM6/NTAB) family NADH-FMN oxidoreductase RutF